MKVGLTGGIGAGKSTVADLFSNKGAVVIRADDLARQVVKPGSVGFDQVVTRFGNKIIGNSGEINREELAAIVFKDSKALTDLESIIHPLVRNETNKIVDKQTTETIVINEIPLLLEKDMGSLFDFLIVVLSNEKNRTTRLLEKGLSKDQIEARMSKQVDDKTRTSAADFVIVNDSNLDQLADDVDKIWQTLQERKFQNK